MRDLTSQRKFYQDHLDELLENIEALESGTVSHRRRSGNGPWEDYTQEILAHDKKMVGVYKSILADIDRRIKGE